MPVHDRGALQVIRFEGNRTDADARGALAACRSLRRRVFIEEQAVPEALEWDELDPEAIHFLVLAAPGDDSIGRNAPLRTPNPIADSSVLGTARMRLFADYAKAERVAVRRDARRLGVGRIVMETLERSARAAGRREIRLHAQLTALPFYEALGFLASGEVFLEAGIAHRAMSKALD